MNTVSTSCSAALVLVLGACASTGDGPTTSSATATAAAATKTGPGAPAAHIEAMAAREIDELPRHPVAVLTPAFTAQVEGTAAPVFTAGAVGSLSIPLGTQLPINCSVQPERVDVAGTLGNIVRTAAANPGLTLQGVHAIDVVVAHEAPLFFAEVAYTVPTPEGAAFGTVKVGIFSHAQVALVCMHDEVGYRASFRRVVKGLADTLELKSPAPAPRYAEIQILRVNDQPVGFAQRTIDDGGDGSTAYASVTSTVLMRSPSEPVASDTYASERADPQGHVVKAIHVAVQGGEIESQMSLDRDGAGYTYGGTWAGKPLEGRFDSAPLPGERLHARLLLEHLQKKGAGELKLPTWSASTDPTAPTPVTYRPTPGAGTARVVDVELGEMKLAAKTDDHGMAEEITILLGKLTLTQTRVFVRGAP